MTQYIYISNWQQYQPNEKGNIYQLEIWNGPIPSEPERKMAKLVNTV